MKGTRASALAIVIMFTKHRLPCLEVKEKDIKHVGSKGDHVDRVQQGDLLHDGHVSELIKDFNVDLNNICLLTIGRDGIRFAVIVRPASTTWQTKKIALK